MAQSLSIPGDFEVSSGMFARELNFGIVRGFDNSSQADSSASGMTIDQ
jgi:hypothetical protein